MQILFPDMKINHFLYVTATIMLSALLVSCGSKTEESAVSTPIDSTNINGTAPVEYEVKSDTSQMLPEEGKGLKANTDSQEIKKQP